MHDIETAAFGETMQGGECARIQRRAREQPRARIPVAYRDDVLRRIADAFVAQRFHRRGEELEFVARRLLAPLRCHQHAARRERRKIVAQGFDG